MRPSTSDALQWFGYHNGFAPSDAFVENFGAPRPGTQAVTPLFNYGSNGGSFGAPVSTPVFGESTTPTFGTSSTIPASPFGTSCTTPTFGTSSTTPTSGTSSTPPFRPSTTPTFTFGTSSTTPTFGTSSIPPFRPSTTPAIGCGSTDEYPYNPTYEICDNTIVGQKPGKLMSISSMKVYNNKSHEELRSEKYQQQRNKAQPFGTISSNCQSAWPQASIRSNISSVQPSQRNPGSLYSVQPSQSNPQNPFSIFGANTTRETQGTTVGTSTVDANTTGAIQYTMVGTSAVDANARATQGITIGTNAFGNYNNQPLAVFGYPAFVTLTHPTAATFAGNHYGLFGSAVPVLGTQASPITVPFGVPTTGAYSIAPVSFGGPSTSFVSHSGANGANEPNSLNGDHLTAPVSIASPNVESFAGPSTSFVGLNFAKQSTINSVGGSHGDKNTCCNKPKVKEEADDCCRVPKGLEVIVDKLGYNPWSERKDICSANKHDLEVEGGILPCEEANNDEDIVALAEFAVEQHNAIHKDETVYFMNVVVACLEAVGHGRYHIVLNAVSTKCADFANQRRHYAVVLRKSTPRLNHMTVLEKWLPGKAV
ncbi:hypothetical protein BVRB_5g120620 isoform B [Beta vulgaris subsp. vulgaris]|nr:hypothetical protein BVRB_5g120620 isoform B [Beta vulgaris subsp. vulgaris]